MIFVRVELLTENAKLPTKATSGSAGFDLYSARDLVVYPNDNALVLTDVSIKMPEGVYGRVAPRSGLALLFKINVHAGVIDADYRFVNIIINIKL